LANQATREEPEQKVFDLAVRFKTANSKGTATVGNSDSKVFTQSLINIFRLNIFEQSQAKRAKLRSKSSKNPLSKITTKERDRIKKLKRLAGRRREESKKKKMWKDYLERLAKGKLQKGEKPPQ
jgi:hypothetical protein